MTESNLACNRRHLTPGAYSGGCRLAGAGFQDADITARRTAEANRSRGAARIHAPRDYRNKARISAATPIRRRCPAAAAHTEPSTEGIPLDTDRVESEISQ